MEFPAYVPAAVRAHITTLLDGDDWEPRGWVANLADAEKRLEEIEAAIETKTRLGEVEYLDSLRKQKVEAVEYRDMVAGNVDCLHRLAHDPRMQGAYAKLTQEFTQDEQWSRFIHAAWAADIDYSKYRERLKRTKELRDKIADTSEKLAGLLRETAKTGFSFWPSEFYSIPELLRQTDNHKMQNHNLSMWRSLRKYVLGDLPKRDIPENKPDENTIDTPAATQIEFVPVGPGEETEIDPAEARRMSLRYYWGTAPDLSELLDTVAKAARDFQPSESGVIGAAIKSRQRSKAGNKEYLRAFGNLLTEGFGITPTTNIMNAMAFVATVVIDDHNFVVTYDDVVKAIGSL